MTHRKILKEGDEVLHKGKKVVIATILGSSRGYEKPDLSVHFYHFDKLLINSSRYIGGDYEVIYDES